MSRSQCHRPPSHRSRNSERWMSGGDVGSVLVSGEGKAVNSERAGGAAGACNHQQSCYCHSPQSKVGVLLMMLPPKKTFKTKFKAKRSKLQQVSVNGSRQTRRERSEGAVRMLAVHREGQLYWKVVRWDYCPLSALHTHTLTHTRYTHTSTQNTRVETVREKAGLVDQWFPEGSSLWPPG